MGFNKRILPKVDELKKIYKNDPESYIRGIIKTDALIGPMESIEWINKKVKEYYDKRESIK
jgi:hypothetical protein